MNTTPQNALNLAARLLFALMFLPAGLMKVADFNGTVGYIASVGLPLPALGALIAIVVEVAGSAALIAGFQTRLVSIVMAVFTLAASVFFHAFWSAPADQAFMTQLLFFKNVAIAGGLLSLAASGAGAWSVDARSLGRWTPGARKAA